MILNGVRRRFRVPATSIPTPTGMIETALTVATGSWCTTADFDVYSRSVLSSGDHHLNRLRHGGYTTQESSYQTQRSHE